MAGCWSAPILAGALWRNPAAPCPFWKVEEAVQPQATNGPSDRDDTARAGARLVQAFPNRRANQRHWTMAARTIYITQLQEELGIRTYFAHPYCSWQRGTNEYTNGLFRRYVPKRTDFRNVTQEQLNDVVHRLNNTPRKVLQYHTPREVFSERLSQLVEAA